MTELTIDRTVANQLANNEVFVEKLINNDYFRQLIVERVIEPAFIPQWVLPPHFHKMVGMSYTRAFSKMRREAWKDGVEYKYDPDGKIWLNWRKIMLWVESGEPKHPPTEI